jgi:hypothetical protein
VVECFNRGLAVPVGGRIPRSPGSIAYRRWRGNTCASLQMLDVQSVARASSVFPIHSENR